MVQRGRQVPTLSSVRSSSPSRSSAPTEKEQLNQDTKSDERGETDSAGNVCAKLKQIPVAGRPSDSPRRASAFGLQGRRSRRNSVDDNASQLSVENLGGSQNDLTLLGRNPDKEMRTHSGRRSIEPPSTPNNERGGFIGTNPFLSARINSGDRSEP